MTLASPPPATAASGVPPPAKIETTPIALFHKGEVAVGMPPEAAFRAFQDLRSGGFESNDLPPGFKSPYEARSWEDGQHGFGVILYDGVVAAAMYQDVRMSLSDLRALAKDYETRLDAVGLSPRRVAGARVNFWIWELPDAHQRLMICGYRTRDDEVQLTACMGVDTVLDALGVSYDDALKDQSTVDGMPAFMGRHAPGSAK